MATKTSSTRKQAEQLGASKYASALEAIKQQLSSNTTQYNSSTSQRIGALDRELGSISAAEATTLKLLGGLKDSTATTYQQAIAQSQQNSAETQAARSQANSNMLSSMEAEAKARGLSSGTGGSYGEYATRLASQDALMNAVSSMNQGALQRAGLNAQDMFSRQQGSASLLSGTAQSMSRGNAQRILDELYNTYLGERSKLEGQHATTLLEKGDYINQTYLTLKEKAAQAKAAKAQAAMQNAIAQGNLNYKNTKLKVDTQYKYDKLASDTAQKDIANKLKAEGFSHKKAMDVAQLLLKQQGHKLNVDKFNWQMANPNKSAGTNITDLIASIR